MRLAVESQTQSIAAIFTHNSIRDAQTCILVDFTTETETSPVQLRITHVNLSSGHYANTVPETIVVQPRVGRQPRQIPRLTLDRQHPLDDEFDETRRDATLTAINPIKKSQYPRTDPQFSPYWNQ